MVRQARGRHCAQRQHHTEAYKWLGAGAFMIGLGAAMASGTGIASADSAGASDSGSKSESHPSSGGTHHPAGSSAHDASRTRSATGHASTAAPSKSASPSRNATVLTSDSSTLAAPAALTQTRAASKAPAVTAPTQQTSTGSLVTAPAPAAVVATAAPQSVSGRIGSWALNGPMIAGSDLWVGSTPYRVVKSAGITVGTTLATTTAQRVTVQYQLQKSWGKGWVNSTWITIRGATTIRGNQAINFGSWTPVAAERWSSSSTTGWRVVYAVQWFDASTNRLLAQTVIIPTKTSENVCSTRGITCRSYSDGIYM